ncbi:hypothetical protein SFC66_04030 [Terribacillus saccharophilus]|uniref:hypothetical protein n=1 Tax=Terribacillus saccharophilus TaxID=361277 RepID=UPI0039827CDE
MSIQITRKTGMLGYASALRLFADGQEETRLISGETYEIKTDQESVDLQVKQFFSRSKTITVKNHSHVTVRTHPLVNLSFTAVFVLLFLRIFVSRTFTFWIILLLIFAVIISLYNNYQITENEPGNDDALAGEQ